MDAITFEFNEYTIQLARGDVLIWRDGRVNEAPIVVLPAHRLQQILATASMLVKAKGGEA